MAVKNAAAAQVNPKIEWLAGVLARAYADAFVSRRDPVDVTPSELPAFILAHVETQADADRKLPEAMRTARRLGPADHVTPAYVASLRERILAKLAERLEAHER